MRGMQANKIIAGAALAMALAVLGGCGGGGGDSVAGGGVGGSGITVASVGKVSDFGSVIVNDIEYATSDAEVVVENKTRGRGDAVVRGNLSRGMVVRVEGLRTADGKTTADRVVYNDNLEGPVDRLTPLDDMVLELVVMGQTVWVDGAAVFQDTTLDAIQPGNVLEISGLIDEAGILFASYVRMKADSFVSTLPVDLKGMVENLNPATRTFTINSLTVDYSSAALSGFAGADPLPGRLVEVNGHLAGPQTLQAARVDAEDELGGEEVESAEIDGFITQFDSPSQFRVGSIGISTDAATRLKDISLEDIQFDTRVIVRGPLMNGTLLADEIRFPERIKLESNVAAVEAGSGLLTLQALSPIAVRADSTTKISGASGLDKIRPGDHVKIFGRSLAQSEMVAAKILVKPANKRAALKGSVDLKAAPAVLVVLGAAIDISSIPAGGFTGKDGRSLTLAEFLAAVQVGDTINVAGTLAGSTVEWTAVAVE